MNALQEKLPQNKKSHRADAQPAPRTNRVSRPHTAVVRLSNWEQGYITAQAKECGISREALLRGLAMGQDIRARPCTHHSQALGLLEECRECLDALRVCCQLYGDSSEQQLTNTMQRITAMEEWLRTNW